MTARYSSIWDRLNGDETTYTRDQFQAWGEIDHPTQFEIVNGSHTYPYEPSYNWQINNWVWVNVMYLWISGEGGITAAQGKAAFSLSDHEADQMEDLRQWIITPVQAIQRIDRFLVVNGYTSLIEQRHPDVTKTVWYNKFGIRADSASG
jgi:hypothetical protein